MSDREGHGHKAVLYKTHFPPLRHKLIERHHCIHRLINHVYTKGPNTFVTHCPTTARRARLHEREGMAGYRRARWLLLGGGVQEGAVWIRSGGEGQLEGSMGQMLVWVLGASWCCNTMRVGYKTGMGFQSGWGFQTRNGIPDTGGDPDRDHGVPDRDGGVPDRWWDTRCRWGSRHGVMGYQIGDDGMPGRDGVTTLMSHWSGILHSVIFSFLSNYLGLFSNWKKEKKLI